jgi:hypothetical protein
MDTNHFRKEFVDQVGSLRNRIYKKVKPKTLNGKFVTGEMLLELMQAYVVAIN